MCVAVTRVEDGDEVCVAVPAHGGQGVKSVEGECLAWSVGVRGPLVRTWADLPGLAAGARDLARNADVGEKPNVQACAELVRVGKIQYHMGVVCCIERGGLGADRGCGFVSAPRFGRVGVCGE